MIKYFTISLLFVFLLSSCQEGWKGYYIKEGVFKIKIPCNPKVSNETQYYLLGEMDMEVTTCEGGALKGFIFQVYHGKIPKLETVDIEHLQSTLINYEEVIFKRDPEVDGVLNDVLCSFDLIRKILETFELASLERYSLKGYPGMQYNFVNSETKEVARVLSYWVNDELFMLYAKGRVSDKILEKKFEDFFDSFELQGVSENPNPNNEIRHQITEKYPSIDYYIFAQHRFIPRPKFELRDTEYGKGLVVSKISIPERSEDLNRLYMHSIMEYEMDITETDSFDLDTFYMNEVNRLKGLRNSKILKIEKTMQSGYEALFFKDKSKDFEEFSETKLVLTGQHLFVIQVITPRDIKYNDYKKKFFRSVRIRKQED